MVAALERPSQKSVKGRFEPVDPAKPDFSTKYSRDLIILARPKPVYTDDARQRNKQGIVLAKIAFLKNGEIGPIIVDPRIDKGLAANVAKFVGMIKFVPAEVDGRPVDVVKVVEYAFAIY